MKKRRHREGKAIYIRVPDDIYEKMKCYCALRQISIKDMIIRHVTRLDHPETIMSNGRSRLRPLQLLETQE